MKHLSSGIMHPQSELFYWKYAMLKREIKIVILLAVLLTIKVSSVYALNYTAKLVADIQPGTANGNPSEMINFGNSLIFRADDGSNGAELWAYDGFNPPVMIANINPAGSSNPSDFTIYNGWLYFRADDGTHGEELWVYDGTNPPAMVSDLAVGLTSSYPNGLTVYNGTLYFAAYLWPQGTELFQYNGAVITLAANINPFDPDGNSNPFSLQIYNNKLYFNATDGINGNELWRYDGTTASLAADIVPGAVGSDPIELTVFDGKLYFVPEAPITGIELWQYDSATGIASLAADIYTGFPNSYPEDLTVYQGKLYFSATNNGSDYKLWSYNGATASPVAGTDSPYWLTEYNGKLYFAGYNWPEGYELISFDGTNVAVAADINPNGDSNPRFPAIFYERLFFQAKDGTHGDELWELSDITGPTVSSTNLTKLNLTGTIKQIMVKFSESVFDPPGSSFPFDVTYPGNYLLVNIGPDQTLNTVSCFAGVSGDDVQIAINSVSYDSATFTSTVNINHGTALPAGKYTLFVCGTTSIIDELENPLNDGADSIINFSITDALPDTGFAPGEHTTVSGKNTLTPFSELWLEVPQLGVGVDILGVPAAGNSWDVSWLGDNAGWLGGSAFPTYEGNTVLTGHVWSANGYPGPFINIKSLQHGDLVRIHAWGMVYTYEVRENRLIHPTQIGTAFRHETYDWVTLMTCEDWQAAAGSYSYRRLVRAILVDISPE